MKMTYLYFLVGTKEHDGFFKIGVSVRPHVRQGQLRQSFDLDKSFCLGYEASHARVNERWLHTNFAKFNASRELIGSSAGNTEWFSMDCFAEILKIIEDSESSDDRKSETGILRIEKEHCSVCVQVPKALYSKIKGRAIMSDSTVQNDILSLLKAHYGG